MMLLKRQREERIKVRFYCSDTVLLSKIKDVGKKREKLRCTHNDVLVS